MASSCPAPRVAASRSAACRGAAAPHSAFGFCHTHRRRQLRTGEAGGPIETPGSHVLCTAGGCQQRAHARGLCRRHYDGWREDRGL
jgi:hypothetical protein